jgi:hypothetical protein
MAIRWIDGTLLSFLLLASPAAAQNASPDTCLQGFVWREAFAGDHVCVDPAVRQRSAADNQLAASRRQPGGGPYGPDTCRAGFVWRETRPQDHVCVTPETRTQAANDNQAAASRVAHPPSGRGSRAGAGAAVGAASGVRLGATVATPQVQPPRLPGSPPPRPQSGSPSKRGFDENGAPYIEDVMPDGSRRRAQRNGVTIINADGSVRGFYPNMFTAANAPRPTPPELPQDPARGRNWVNYHNEQLLSLISILVNGDTAQMDQFHRAENKAAGSDPFQQIQYRMQVLDVLAKP